MRIFESWKDSLKLCNPEAVKLFALVTLKTMYEVVKTLCTSWFLIPIIFFICLASLLGGVQGLAGSISFAASVASVFFLVAARPSVGIKNFEYFRHNMLRALWLIVVSMGLGLLLMLPMLVPFIISAIILAFLPAFFDLSILFYLDYTDGVLNAFKRAFRMIVYNYPLFVIYVGGLTIVGMLIVMPMTIVNFKADIVDVDRVSSGLLFTNIITSIWKMLFALMIKCVAVNLYIKRIHDQSELYQ